MSDINFEDQKENDMSKTKIIEKQNSSTILRLDQIDEKPRRAAAGLPEAGDSSRNARVTSHRYGEDVGGSSV